VGYRSLGKRQQGSPKAAPSREARALAVDVICMSHSGKEVSASPQPFQAFTEPPATVAKRRICTGARRAKPPPSYQLSHNFALVEHQNTPKHADCYSPDNPKLPEAHHDAGQPAQHRAAAPSDISGSSAPEPGRAALASGDGGEATAGGSERRQGRPCRAALGTLTCSETLVAAGWAAGRPGEWQKASGGDPYAIRVHCMRTLSTARPAAPSPFRSCRCRR
jgi:hypothetical protein